MARYSGKVSPVTGKAWPSDSMQSIRNQIDETLQGLDPNHRDTRTWVRRPTSLPARNGRPGIGTKGMPGFHTMPTTMLVGKDGGEHPTYHVVIQADGQLLGTPAYLRDLGQKDPTPRYAALHAELAEGAGHIALYGLRRDGWEEIPEQRPGDNEKLMTVSALAAKQYHEQRELADRPATLSLGHIALQDH